MKRKFSTSKFFLKIAFLIAVFLVAIFASPLVLDVNSYKSEFENKLSIALNTDVRIEGDIAYRFNLGPKLKFKNIILNAREGNTLNGNIENLNLSINPFLLFKKKFLFEKFSIVNGSLSISEVLFKSYIRNKPQFKKINFENIDFKITSNLSEIEFDNNSGVFLFNPQNLIAVKLKGIFSNLLYNLKYKNNKLEFNIPKKKIFLEYTNQNLVNQNSFIEVKLSDKFLFPGLQNIYIRSNVLFDNNKLEFNNAKISSSVYNGSGVFTLKTASDTPFINADLKFGRSNFLKISKSEWVSFFNKELFQVALLMNGNFKINFQHVFFNQNYFNDLNLDISFIGGDIVLNHIQFISNKNSLNLSGRLIQENNDFLLFFDTSFDTKQLKKLCIKTCETKAKNNTYSMKAKGILNLKKSKFIIKSFFSDREYSQFQINELNQNLKTVFFGDLAKTFELKNYLRLY